MAKNNKCEPDMAIKSLKSFLNTLNSIKEKQDLLKFWNSAKVVPLCQRPVCRWEETRTGRLCMLPYSVAGSLSSSAIHQQNLHKTIIIIIILTSIENMNVLFFLNIFFKFQHREVGIKIAFQVFTSSGHGYCEFLSTLYLDICILYTLHICV